MIRFCVHNWSGWSKPVDTYYSNEKDQFRYCTKCNKVQTRTFKCSVSVPAKTIIEVLANIDKEEQHDPK